MQGENKAKKSSGFTPLEKTADFSRRLLPHKANGGLKPPSAQAVRERRSLTGFTLIEVFLGVALFGMILVAIFSTYTAAVRIWRSVKVLKLTEERRFVIATEKIKREISSYIRGFKDINFYGEKDRVSFPGISDSRVVTITYAFEKNHNALVRKERKFSESLKDKMSEETKELFEAEDVDFSYLIYDSAQGVGAWVTKFSEEDEQIPKAIKLDIRRNDTTKSVVVFIPE